MHMEDAVDEHGNLSGFIDDEAIEETDNEGGMEGVEDVDKQCIEMDHEVEGEGEGGDQQEGDESQREDNRVDANDHDEEGHGEYMSVDSPESRRAIHLLKPRYCVAEETSQSTSGADLEPEAEGVQETVRFITQFILIVRPFDSYAVYVQHAGRGI